MTVRFHCTLATRRAAKKSKHGVIEQCETVKAVLRLNHEHGLVIPRHAPLRKMRIQVPRFHMGKSGGYRAIYQSQETEGGTSIVFLAVYFKGDCEDLADDQYSELRTHAENILGDPLSFDWEA